MAQIYRTRPNHAARKLARGLGWFSLALGLTDRVMCMENGRHVVTGTPDEVRKNDRVREIYLGRRDKR